MIEMALKASPRIAYATIFNSIPALFRNAGRTGIEK
jgi:hypothetical protein